MRKVTPVCFLCFVILHGCSTKLVEKKEDSFIDKLPLNENVSFEINQSMKSYIPKCISVLSFDDPGFLDKDKEFQRAFHAQLSTTGVRLIPLQANATSKNLPTRFPECDMKLTGLVLANERKFYGVYSEYRASAKTNLIHIPTGKIFWQAKHSLVKRGGAIPLGIFSTVAGIFTASKNVEDAQTGRVSYELAHEMVRTIPNLIFQEQFNLKDKQGLETAAFKPKNCPEAIYDFLAKSDQYENDKKINFLITEFKDEKICSDIESKKILAERIQSIDEKNSDANAWLVEYYFSNKNYSQAINAGSLLIDGGDRSEKVFLYRGQSYRALGQQENAIR